MALGVKLKKARLELQARLGFGSSDNPVMSPILNSFIDEAERQLYSIGDFKYLQTYWDVTAAAGSAIVGYPTDVTKGDCNPDKIYDVRVNIGTVGSPSWAPVKEGIRPSDYNNALTSWPQRYERRSGGFEFSPPRDSDYTIRVFSARTRPQLTQDDNAMLIDWDLVFPLALAAAKSHYRHPDAQLYLTKANNILNSVKWQQHGPRIFSPPGREDDDPLPKPQVV